MSRQGIRYDRAMRGAGVASAALCLALLGPAPAVRAQEGQLFTPPPGCTAFLSVQSRGCIVSHHWTCEADPEGHSWRVAIDGDGPFYLSYTDTEFRWLRGFDLRTGSQTTLVEPEEDPASLSELLETGRDSMVFTTVRELDGRFEQRDYTGFDALTGDSVVVDGRTLLVTEFTYQYDTGLGVRRTAGNQYVSAEMGLFFGGLETVTFPSGETAEGNYSPMEFAEPGERGFLTREPIYDCGDTMSSLRLAPEDRG